MGKRETDGVASMAEDYYKILGVTRKASTADIKKAYRKMARKYHPDVNPGDAQAEARFKQISQAYEVLSDPDRRKMFDQFGTDKPPHMGAGKSQGPNFGDFDFRGFDFSNAQQSSFRDFSDIFSEVFGRGTGEAKPKSSVRGQDIQHSLTLSFFEAIRGLTISLKVDRSETCSSCGGHQTVRVGNRSTCAECGGRGKVRLQQGNMVFETTCRHCEGKGYRDREPCPSCKGRGVQPKREVVKVSIPPGVDNGSRVRVAGKGEAGVMGGPAGDLYIITKVQEHAFFERKGANLYCHVPISFTEATLGAKIQVPTVDGSSTIKIPPGTQNGQKFRIRGKGVPALRTDQRGDQFVEVTVHVPRIRDERSKEILREFQQLNPENPRDDLNVKGF